MTSLFTNIPDGTKDEKRRRSGRVVECINISFSPSLQEWTILSKGNKILKG
jgi:hypothetical protein